MNRINFREIARELNISHTTVYRVINNAHCVSDATRVRVIDALNRHGCYRDARVKPQTVLLDFDENAACHLAFGDAYPECVRGGEDMTAEELAAAGLNHSDTHVDFMIGTRDLSIVGTRADGEEIAVFENGNFTF